MRPSTIRRPGAINTLMLVVGAAVLAVSLLVGARLAGATAAGVNFLPTYSAATSIAQGRAAEMYDRPAELLAHDAILPGRPAQLAPYLNPPAAALLVVPLTRLRFATAYVVWAGIQVLLLVTGALLLVRGRRRDLVAPLLFCLGGVWCALDVVLGGLSEPHLLVGVAVYLLVRREWRLVCAAAAGVLAVLVAPSMLLAPHLLGDFVHAMASSGVDALSQRFVSLSGLVYSWFGISAASRIAGLLLSVGAVGLVVRLATRRGGDPMHRDAAVVTLSLLISPHLLGYDPVLLLPFLVPVLAGPRRRGVLVGLLLLLDAASWADLGNITLFPPGRLTTPVLALLAGWWLWEARRGVGARPGEPDVGVGALFAA